MGYYIVNKNAQATGEHEVHILNCGLKPEPENRVSLGYHSNCSDAILEAKRHYLNVDGCFYCCKECHTR